MEGFPWDDLRKILHWRQRVASVHSAKETLPKGSTPWVGFTSVTDDRRNYDSKDPNVTWSRSGKNLGGDSIITYNALFFAAELSVFFNFNALKSGLMSGLRHKHVTYWGIDWIGNNIILKLFQPSSMSVWNNFGKIISNLFQRLIAAHEYFSTCWMSLK